MTKSSYSGHLWIRFNSVAANRCSLALPHERLRDFKSNSLFVQSRTRLTLSN